MTYRSWKKIKNIRVVVSLAFLAAFTAMFVDAWHIVPGSVTVIFTSLQFAPAIIKVIMLGGAAAVVSLISLTAITLLFGRVYCSTICPLGVLQDLFSRLARKLDRRKRFGFNPAPHLFQYSLLAVSTLLVLLGSAMVFGDLLEPFSNYGRIVNAFILPAIVLANNAAAEILGKHSIYFLYNIQLHMETAGAISLGLLFLATLGYMSMKEGRLFCNTFCPTGAILSLLSKLSLYKLVIEKDSCNDCGACDRVCKAECIDSVSKRIDFSACVGCFNCLSSCPKDAINYERAPVPSLTPAPAAFDPARREFFRNVTVPTAALILAPGIVEGSSMFVKQTKPITPPGSLDIRHFTSTCTACHLCVTSCPTGVLQPSFMEFGLTGIFQPKMDYSVNYCNYDCVICGEVCPTGAIMPLDVPAKKLVQIGKSKFTKEDCVVVSKKKDCAACSEHCPTKAVHTIPYENGLFLPEVDNELCIGCGACEHACPVTPKKAIVVISNDVHLTAKKPKAEKPAQPAPSAAGEFPF